MKKLADAVKLKMDSVQYGAHCYTGVEFLAVQSVLKNFCLNLESQFANTFLDPVANSSMVATVNIADIIAAIGNVGSVEERLPCSPGLSSLVGINSNFPIGITMGCPHTLIVQTCTSENEPMETGQLEVRAWVTNELRRRVCDAEVSNSGKDKYSVTFCVQEECLGKAHFTADGEHINGNLFDVIVRDYAQVREPVSGRSRIFKRRFQKSSGA